MDGTQAGFVCSFQVQVSYCLSFFAGWYHLTHVFSVSEFGKTRRVVYEDGDGEDMQLKEIRKAVELAKRAGKSVEGDTFSKGYSLRVGDIVKYDDSTNVDEFGVEAEAHAKVVSIRIRGREKKKWTIVTKPEHCGLKAGNDERLEVVSSKYHLLDAPPPEVIVNISELNLIPGECIEESDEEEGEGKMEGLDALSEAATGEPQTRSKRKETGMVKFGEEEKTKKKKKKK